MIETTTKRTKSEARRAYWASIPKEERSKHAAHAARVKAKKMTAKERRDHALMMLLAKKNKKEE